MSYMEFPRYGKTVIPSDVENISAHGPLYVGQSGDIKVRFYNDEDVTFTCYPVGDFPYIIKKLYKTGTTAGNFIETSIDKEGL